MEKGNAFLPGISVRLASDDDAATLAELGARLFDQAFGSMNEPANMKAYLESAFSPEKQRDELRDQDRVTWLAENERGEAVGYVMLRRGTIGDGVVASRPAEVQRIYADQTVRGQGLGRVLIERCIDRAREWGADALWLGVWEKNTAAIGFYERMGFRKVGRAVFVVGSDPQSDFVMARTL